MIQIAGFLLKEHLDNPAKSEKGNMKIFCSTNNIKTNNNET